ncbi:MAG: DUF1385 domain-containing protein [Lachnospiraceae bacterium]|nr:DUF1385 domain-containing protein [Lachnospiraceae bacterium]MBR4175128.1 DUF1385 domain-containing protein [Lachnospiraceae bacterium]
MSKKRYSGIGGQAVMEGIMMRNKEKYSVAVRKSDGEIEVMTGTYEPPIPEKITSLPFIRGTFVMINSLVLGMKTLGWSAEFFEEDEEEGTVKGTEKGADDTSKKEDKEKGISPLMMGLTVCFSLVLSLGLFMFLPYFLSELLRNVVKSNTLILIFEALLKLIIFVAYVAAISLMDDIKRVYMYHGAEHKCINCVENGMELNVENVMKSDRLHPRCGTSFMVFVLIVSIILFMFIRTDSRLMRFAIRLVLIPVIAGISYEIIRWAGSSSNPIVKILSMPGLCVQKLTTREPDEKMAEVAIRAVEEVFDWRAYLQELKGENGELP